MEVTDYAFFPTRVVTIQFPDTDPLNADLCDLFECRPELDDRFNMHPDALNLLRLADTVPAIEQLRSMFITGVKHWLEVEGIVGMEGIDLLLFSNRMGRGESTIVHNLSLGALIPDADGRVKTGSEQVGQRSRFWDR